MSIYELALLSACTTIFINYCIGKPGSEFSPYEIFSSYTVWLSKRRLKKVKLFNTYYPQLIDSINTAKTDSQVISIRKDFDIILYNSASPFFTWERAVGMCPICTGVWISLIISILAQANVLHIVEIIVISHIIIRILNKVI
jgi:hypothetical protein